MSTFDESALIDYVTQQRWYGAKTRAVSESHLLDAVTLRGDEPQFALALMQLRYETGAHDFYQLLYTSHDGEPSLDGLAENPELARELALAMRGSRVLHGEQGVAEFERVDGFAGLDGEPGDVRLVGSEQSNTSIVFGEKLILKVFRRVEPGTNPELEMLRFLTGHRFRQIPALGGWYSYSGGPLSATLGILQEFVAGAQDGWALALQELGRAPDSFLGRLHRLGEVTGQMHSVLGSDLNDPNFAPEEPSVESLGLLTATVDEEIARVFVSLPEDDERLAPIYGRGEEVREQLRLLASAGTTGRVIRAHGDYHLGQTLWSGSDWVILDFEGEPARPLVERRRKRSPLRDVAGMLRSFAYAATSARVVHGFGVSDDWEDRARERFLEGYLAAVDPILLPSGQGALERLLAVFELEKAVYELRYELDNRPDWVGIPVAGIQRLIEATATAAS